MTDEKYLINVDFPAESIVHLNPLLYQTNPSCKTGLKNPEHGGLILATAEEVSNYLDGIVRRQNMKLRCTGCANIYCFEKLCKCRCHKLVIAIGD